MGLSGRVPARVEAATKAGLLDLLEQAVEAGWQFRAACQVLELGTDGRYVHAIAEEAGVVSPPGCEGLAIDLSALWIEVDRFLDHI